MLGPPRVPSTNSVDRVSRPVLGPAGNKLHRGPAMKSAKKPGKVVPEDPVRPKEKNRNIATLKSQPPSSPTTTLPLCSPRRNMVSMSASCSSDASSSCSSSPLSVASSSGRRRSVPRRNVAALTAGARRKQTDERIGEGGDGCCFSDGKIRCAWITPNSDPCYVAFHDGEWGVPVYDDKKLFEFLCLSGALAELTWTDILNKRQTFREIFLDFEPMEVSKLNPEKLMAKGSVVWSLLSELKLRLIVENAVQMRKIILEFGSFGKYIWNFVNHKPIPSQFRYARQVPLKTSKAEFISKDLVRRGFRSVGPTVIYSFMQVAGLVNDHLATCFRYQECIVGLDSRVSHENNGNS